VGILVRGIVTIGGFLFGFSGELLEGLVVGLVIGG